MVAHHSQLAKKFSDARSGTLFLKIFCVARGSMQFVFEKNLRRT